MTTVTELADELLTVLHHESPLAASLRGIRDYDHRLPDLSVQADLALRARAEGITQRARAVPEGLDEQDAMTRAVVVQQAMALVARVDAKLIEHTVAFPLTAPAASLLHRLPLLLPWGDDEQRAF